MPEAHRVPTAEQIMVTSLITFRPETNIGDAIAVLLSKQISGAPVTDSDGRLVGVLSELDCLRVLSSDEFYAGDQEGMGRVENFMTRDCTTITPDTDLYGIAHYFLTKGLRRLPVVSGAKLVGQVSRRDVLGLIDRMSRQRTDRKHYPDYREPGKVFIPTGSSRAATRSIV
ncbi:MAG: CBS domain-containing protein [Actinomycetota bacterium]|nr:CBS domain-containing protein [Actinomycetota bacterium]